MQWGSWSSWTECSRSCGGGHRKRDRVCVKKEGNKEGCFMDGPNGDKRYRLQEELCNPIPCPSEKTSPTNTCFIKINALTSVLSHFN